MRCDIGGGCYQNEPCQITHCIQEVGFATIVGDVTRGPEVDMEDVEGATERPGKDEFAVAGDGPVSSNAMWALETPVGDILATVGPKEAETNAMECFVDTHMSGSRGGVICGEDIAMKGRWDDDEH